MTKRIISRLSIFAAGMFCLVSWTDPVTLDMISSNLDEHEEIIRERIPAVVSIVNPVYNPAVRSYLDIYINRRPDQTANMLGWASVYFPIFEKALAEEGLPTDLKYLAIVESALNPNAISRSGAGGLWQFMKPTARECGLKISSYVDERMDPEKSSKAAAKYLKQLYTYFGNWELVMAAYNAGPGRIRSAVKRAGTSDYWEMSRYLPSETRSYVPGFIAASYLMNYHEAHNLIPVYPSSCMSEIMSVYVYEGMSISEVARRSGLTIEDVKRLNPTFVRNYVPASPSGYVLNLPFAAAELFNSGRSMEIPEVLLEADGVTKTVTTDGFTYKITTTTKEYIVRSGDNLYTLAQRNKCSVRELMNWNGLHDSRLHIGQRLEIQYVTKELVPAVIEAVIPVVTARTSQPVDALSSLTLELLPVDATREVQFDMAPVVQEQTKDVFVLQRRQSIRQALNQYQLNTNTTVATTLLPMSPLAGDVVRVR